MTRYCTQYVINRLGHSRALRDIILLEGYQLKTAAHTRYCGLSGGGGRCGAYYKSTSFPMTQFSLRNAFEDHK